MPTRRRRTDPFTVGSCPQSVKQASGPAGCQPARAAQSSYLIASCEAAKAMAALCAHGGPEADRRGHSRARPEPGVAAAWPGELGRSPVIVPKARRQRGRRIAVRWSDPAADFRVGSGTSGRMDSTLSSCDRRLLAGGRRSFGCSWRVAATMAAGRRLPTRPAAFPCGLTRG